MLRIVPAATMSSFLHGGGDVRNVTTTTDACSAPYMPKDATAPSAGRQRLEATNAAETHASRTKCRE
jgi:hypothetical protein